MKFEKRGMRKFAIPLLFQNAKVLSVNDEII
jgi:hypothetical protein